MKSDEDVRMISAEAPVLFAKACELFILDMALRCVPCSCLRPCVCVPVSLCPCVPVSLCPCVPASLRP
jgi:hypothetical protein